MRTKKRVSVFVLGWMLAFAALTGQAGASRADGVCGGIGSWDPVTHECV